MSFDLLSGIVCMFSRCPHFSGGEVGVLSRERYMGFHRMTQTGKRLSSFRSSCFLVKRCCVATEQTLKLALRNSEFMHLTN